MIKRFGPALLAVALAGCLREDDDEENELPPANPTAAGYWITVPPIAAGIPSETIMQQLDARINEWVYEHPEQDENHLRAVAMQYQYIIVDHYKFESAASPTGWATGEIWTSGALYVRLALYASEEAMRNGDLTHSLPATGHELNHALGIRD